MSRAPLAPPPASVQEGVFHTAFLLSPAMQSVVRAADGTIVEVNDTFLTKFGFARSQVIGKTPADLAFWVEPEKQRAWRQRLDAGESVTGYEVQLRAVDGRIFHVLLSTHPVDIGGVRHFVTAGVDITARKEMEARLRERDRQLDESELRFRTAFHASPVMQSIVRFPDNVIVEINGTFTQVLGYAREEVLGRTPFDLNFWVRPELMPALRAKLETERRVRGHEIQVRAKDGGVRTVLLSAEVVEIAGVPHAMNASVDITERKRAEAELQHALAKERELGLLKSEFVSLVSHEFRTPLEVIMSSADNLGRYHDRLDAERRAHLLRTINKSVRRMADMMEEVLVLGRLESDRMTFRPAAFDLGGFFRRVVDELVSATGARCPVRLHLEAAGRGHGDETVLRHIFANLISNAVKYSPAGAAVEVAVGRDGDRAVCRVADRGCGIPAADQPRLFEAFHRGGNVRHVPGTGLGLLIVRRCVELHGGELAFESAEGRGTTFTVRLPLFAAAAETAPESGP